MCVIHFMLIIDPAHSQTPYAYMYMHVLAHRGTRRFILRSYVRTYVCMSVCVYVRTYVCMSVCVCVYVYTVYVCMCVCTYVCTCVHVYVCMYLCMYVCMYVRMHVYLHTHILTILSVAIFGKLKSTSQLQVPLIAHATCCYMSCIRLHQLSLPGEGWIFICFSNASCVFKWSNHGVQWC